MLSNIMTSHTPAFGIDSLFSKTGIRLTGTYIGAMKPNQVIITLEYKRTEQTFWYKSALKTKQLLETSHMFSVHWGTVKQTEGSYTAIGQPTLTEEGTSNARQKEEISLETLH